MKKIFSFLLFGVLSLFIYASGITIGGKTYAVDTIVHSHDIGPGKSSVRRTAISINFKTPSK